MKVRRTKTAKTQRRARATVKPPRVVVVGFGRVGGALALGLRDAGWEVSTLPRSGESVRRAASLKVVLADHDALRGAELCFLAVPDSAVAQAAELVEEDLNPTAAVVHCSGALTLDGLGAAPQRSGRPVGSFHPLVAISDPLDSLEGASAAVAASGRDLLPLLQRVARTLQMKPVEVPETGRAAYHAGAVMSAGLLVALADAAVCALEHAGLSRDEALEGLLPLMRSALRGVETRGLARGLTGPVVRGDVSVVQAHLATLPADLGAIYRLLSQRALKLTQNLPSETRLALERILA